MLSTMHSHVFVVFGLILHVVADDGDDFSNNLFTDFAPILALFGERVTMQFMSQAMGWADHIILAMAPIGIITAIVGAIRVAGPSWLKAIIGRARESRAIPEAELMSSTSHEVCELWNGHEIVRVMGKGPIREFILLPRVDDDFGIFKAVKATRPEHMAAEYLAMKGLTFRENLTGMKYRKLMHAESSENSRFTIVIRNETVATPNLTLNVHGRLDRRGHYIAAIWGIVLQFGVLLYFGFATYYPKLMLKKNGGRVAGYAFPCTAIGTICLAGGIMLCSRVVKANTEERSYTPRGGREARVVWVQKSGTVSDQTFGSFAVVPIGSQRIITTSTRSEGPVSQSSAVVATFVCLMGFVVQFVGLRGMHWSAPIVQLGATITMTAIRAWVRRHLAQLPASQGLMSGFELDWLALSLCMKATDEPWSKLSGEAQKPERHWLKGKERQDWVISSVQDPEACPVLETETRTVLKKSEANWATNVMEVRRELGRLADWPGIASTEAIRLARAIEVTMGILDPLFGFDDQPRKMTWSMRVNDERIHLHLERTRPGSWKAPADELDAALSIWLYYIEDQVNTAKTKYLPRDTENDDSWLRSKGMPNESSLILLGGWSPALERDLAWWVPGDAPLTIDLEAKKIKTKRHRIVGFMHNYDDDSLPCQTSQSTPSSQNLTLAEESFNPLPEVYSRYLFSTFMCSAAKALKRPIPGHSEVKPLSGEDINSTWGPYKLQNAHLSELVQEVHKTDFGTLEETYLAIIPSLSTARCLPEPEEIVHCVRKHAQPHEQLGHWENVTDAYVELFEISKSFPSTSTIFVKSLALLLGCLQAIESALMVTNKQALGYEIIEKLGSSRASILNHLRDVDRNIASPPKGLLLIQRSGLYISPGLGAKASTSIPLSDLKDGVMEECQVWMAISQILQSRPKVKAKLWDTRRPDLGNNKLNSLSRILRLSELHILVMRDGNMKDFLDQGENFHYVDCRDVFECTPLHYAGGLESTLNLEDFLSLGPDLNARNYCGRTPLHIFCQWGSAKSIRRLLREGADINIRDNDRRAPLHYGAEDGCEDVVQVLVEAGANLNITDSHGNTPLFLAAFHGHDILFEHLWNEAQRRLRNNNDRTSLHLAALGTQDKGISIRKLMSFNLDVEARDAFGRTPLHYAALSGNLHVVRVLLDYHADIEAEDSERGCTPLYLAAEQGKKAIVRLLIRRGASVHGNSALLPLCAAARCGHYQIVKLLLAKGAKVDDGGRINQTALHCAAERGHARVVDLLLLEGADRECEFIKGRPIHSAVDGGHEEVVKVLLDWKVEIDGGQCTRLRMFLDGKAVAPELGYLRTPVYSAAKCGYNRLVERLLDAGALIEDGIKRNDKPLHAAAEKGHLETVRLLIRRGAKKDSSGHLMETPLHVAAKMGHCPLVQLLFDEGVGVDTKNIDGMTPLSDAAKKGHFEVVRLFLRLRASVSTKDSIFHRTPLHHAAKSGHELVVKILIDRGAEVDSRDREGRTPLLLAAEEIKRGVVQLLLDQGADREAVDTEGKRAFELAQEVGDYELAQLLQVDNTPSESQS
ncbi:ankyrin repeat protein [Fusarium austroafricanum]|uniref:Ankyrin repeat protein n=1 Tax=Fusarium austroafricanum TaxID=2364996 RepID=A0A8H4NLQ2_9HYPO|nr:ankyrin repeat protein [Fusarium austroafricanum]